MNTQNPNHKERYAAETLAKWEELVAFMEGEILTPIRAAKFVNPSAYSKLQELTRNLPYNIRTLCKTDKQEKEEKISSGEITPEMIKGEAEEDAKRAKIAQEYRDKCGRGQSCIQKCVNTWLSEQLEENGIKLEVLNDDDTESFEFTVIESRNESYSGCTDFSVPDQAKAILNTLFENDNGESFEDRLRELLVRELHDSFEVETDYNGDGETTDMEYELR